MMGLIGFTVLGVILFVLLWLAVSIRPTRNYLSSTELVGSWREIRPCQPEVIARLFSRDDWEFVAQLEPHLQKQLLQDRSWLAIGWLQRTSTGIRLTMREHARMSRHAEALRGSVEAKVIAQFFLLLFVCHLFILLVRCFGPFMLHSSAVHLGRFFQRLMDSLQVETAAAGVPSEVTGNKSH
jgi:hypothetical protein